MQILTRTAINPISEAPAPASQIHRIIADAFPDGPLIRNNLQHSLGLTELNGETFEDFDLPEGAFSKTINATGERTFFIVDADGARPTSEEEAKAVAIRQGQGRAATRANLVGAPTPEMLAKARELIAFWGAKEGGFIKSGDDTTGPLPVPVLAKASAQTVLAFIDEVTGSDNEF